MFPDSVSSFEWFLTLLSNQIPDNIYSASVPHSSPTASAQAFPAPVSEIGLQQNR